jgi:flagellar assembly factor FliW
MVIQSKAFGEIKVDQRQKIYFPYGLFGFEGHKEYVILDSEKPPFFWLQSLQDPQVAFILLSPFVFRPDYSLDISSQDLEEIEVEEKDDVLVFSIVTIPENQQEMTANLQGPIVVNRKKRIARQCISTNTNWKIRHMVMDELKQARKAKC